MAISPVPPISPVALINQADKVQDIINSSKVAVPEVNQSGGIKLGTDFGEFLTDAIKQVDDLQKTGEVASVGLATGQIQDVHTAMIALEKANLSLSMATQVRNKVIEAYQEVMRMQL